MVEDDAQDGPDHVDAHRSTALVISPFTQHAGVDSTHYDTAGMLGEIEDILGLEPMSIFDQRGTRMWPSFARWPNMRPFDVLATRVIPFGDPGYPRNGRNSPLAAASAAQNYSIPDGPDEQRVERGDLAIHPRRPHSHMPGPAPGSGGGED